MHFRQVEYNEYDRANLLRARVGISFEVIILC